MENKKLPPISVDNSIGLFLIKRDSLTMGLKYLNQACKLYPNSRMCNVNRLLGKLRVFHFKTASEDVEILLKNNPNDTFVIYLQGYLEFLKSNFESGLVLNMRNLNGAYKQYFKEAVGHCLAAIYHALIPINGHPLRDYYKKIRWMAWKAEMLKDLKRRKKLREAKRRIVTLKIMHDPTLQTANPQQDVKMSYGVASEDELDKMISQQSIYTRNKRIMGRRRKSLDPWMSLYEPQFSMSSTILDSEKSLEKTSYELLITTGSEEIIESSLDDSCLSLKRKIIKKKIPPIKYPFRPPQPRTTNIDKLLSANYLGPAYIDLFFLKDFGTIDGVFCQNKRHNKELIELAETCQKRCQKVQERLRSKHPFYAFKYSEREYLKASPRLVTRRQKMQTDMEEAAEKKANQLMNTMKSYANRGKINQLVEVAEYFRIFCSTTLKRHLKNEDQLLLEMYDLVCDTFYNTYTVDVMASIAVKMNKAKQALGYPVSRRSSNESLFAPVKTRVQGKLRNLKVKYEQRVRNCKCVEELIWLYHELSRFLVEMKDYNLAKIYGSKCFNESKKADKTKWMINALMMLTKISVLLKSKSDATRNIKTAYICGKLMDDPNLAAFLSTCVDVVKNTPIAIYTPGNTMKKRQHTIKNLMGTNELKQQAERLFTQINQKKNNRGLSIVPGVVFQELKKSPPLTSSKTKLITSKSKYQKGVSFINDVTDYFD